VRAQRPRRRPRSWALLPARAAGVGALLLALSGCGSVHPGAAAVVGDTRVSFDEVDTLSVAYCQATLAISEVQGSPVTPTQGIESRRSVVGLILQRELARQAADSLGIEVAPAAYVADAQSYEPLVAAVGDEYADEISELVELTGEATALREAIGAQQLEQDVSELLTRQQVEEAQQAGQDYITEFASGVEIDLDPRLALAPDGDVLAETGSLSAPVSGDAVSSVESVDALPAAQVCR